MIVGFGNFSLRPMGLVKLSLIQKKNRIGVLPTGCLCLIISLYASSSNMT